MQEWQCYAHCMHSKCKSRPVVHKSPIKQFHSKRLHTKLGNCRDCQICSLLPTLTVTQVNQRIEAETRQIMNRIHCGTEASEDGQTVLGRCGQISYHQHGLLASILLQWLIVYCNIWLTYWQVLMTEMFNINSCIVYCVTVTVCYKFK